MDRDVLPRSECNDCGHGWTPPEVFQGFYDCDTPCPRCTSPNVTTHFPVRIELPAGAFLVGGDMGEA